MKKLFYILLFILFFSPLLAQTEKSRAVGIEYYDGLTYKRYLTKFSYEVNLGYSYGFNLDWSPTLKFLYFYQPMQRTIFQPYVGIGIVGIYNLKNELREKLYGSDFSENQLFLGLEGKIGVDIRPKKSMFSYTFDLGYGYSKSLSNPDRTWDIPSFGIGFRYHF